MYEHTLNWVSADGKGETMVLVSPSIKPDRFWATVKTIVNEKLIPAAPGTNPDLSVVTREQFRMIVKELVRTGDFELAQPRIKAVHQFVTGSEWTTIEK